MAATVVTMLPSSPQVNAVYLAEHGILQALRETPASSPFLAIDSTTLDVSTAKDVAQKITSASQSPGQISMVDAPVSGGKGAVGSGGQGRLSKIEKRKNVHCAYTLCPLPRSLIPKQSKGLWTVTDTHPLCCRRT